MPHIHPAARAHERARWQRADAHRFIRPDWRRFARPGSELEALYESFERKYSPNQRRVPAGVREGGQWTSGGGGRSARDTPKTPPGINIDDNIKEAEAHKLNYLWFYQKVRNGGPWDYKQVDKDYADFGNYNYGATGRGLAFRKQHS